MKVKAYKSQCIGLIIIGFHYYGEIVKTNKKSIRVEFNRFVKTEGKKTVMDVNYPETATFTYWKTITRENKAVDLYKNQIYGLIEIVK